MQYISTRGKAAARGFEDVLLAGLAEDGGLYMPAHWPQLTQQQIAAFADRPFHEVAAQVMRPYMGEAADRFPLDAICAAAYADFTHPDIAPLVPLEDGHHLLELFHGPTLAFKDIAMQVLARLMDDALARRGQRRTIVVATSGDTGSAAVSAFGGRESVDVFVLYPHGRISDAQRRQMTVPQADNVHALAIDGTFDDCQTLVKALFADAPFRDAVSLAAVNSINWVRVMAQAVYYFTAALRLGAPERAAAFCVPTGNFGDIFAGLVAHKMGLPVARLVIATNMNDILARTLDTGRYEPQAVVATSSPSMDIQISSNFERLLFDAAGGDAAWVCEAMGQLETEGHFDLRDDVLAAIRNLFAAFRIDEAEGAATIAEVYEQHGKLIDPHTAIGLAAARRTTLPDDVPMVTLATAHPAKFPEAVAHACKATPEPPDRLRAVLSGTERIAELPARADAVQDFIRAKGRGR